MRAVRIVIGILFLVVIARGIALLGEGTSGTAYPVAAIAGGVAGCLVLFVKRRR